MGRDALEAIDRARARPAVGAGQADKGVRAARGSAIVKQDP